MLFHILCTSVEGFPQISSLYPTEMRYWSHDRGSAATRRHRGGRRRPPPGARRPARGRTRACARESGPRRRGRCRGGPGSPHDARRAGLPVARPSIRGRDQGAAVEHRRDRSCSGCGASSCAGAPRGRGEGGLPAARGEPAPGDAGRPLRGVADAQGVAVRGRSEPGDLPATGPEHAGHAHRPGRGHAEPPLGAHRRLGDGAGAAACAGTGRHDAHRAAPRPAGLRHPGDLRPRRTDAPCAGSGRGRRSAIVGR